MKKLIQSVVLLMAVATVFNACKPKGPQGAITGDAAAKVYVAPGQYDEFYNIVSGGFNGQMSI
jgi:nitrous-oxide reductase